MKSQSRKLRVAIIGAGAIAQRRHVPEYSYRNDVEMVAIVDLKKARAQEVADEYKIPHVFRDYRDALKLGVDLVSVCTPCAFHAQHTIAALKAKAHVLCEKPMAASVKECRAMIAAARANRRQLMIGHNQRFAAAHVKGKEILQSGILGRCISFSTTFAHSGPEHWSVDEDRPHFFNRRQAAFGCFGDLGVHKADLMRWLLEDDFVEATAMYGRLIKPNCDVEDNAFAVLRTQRGILGQLHAGWARISGGDNSTQLFCEKGVLRLEDDPQYPVVVEFQRGERNFIKTRAIQSNEVQGQYRSGVIDAFVDSVKSGRKNPIPGEDGARSLATIEACVKSGKTGKAVKVAKIQ